MIAAGRAVPLAAPVLDRRFFPVTAGWAYCNHAAVGPLPVGTRDAVLSVLDAQMRDGSAGILDVEANLESVRAQTAHAIGASSEEVAFLRSTSDGALVVANGLAWRPGDEIVMSDDEFGANAYPWLNLRDRGVRIRLVRAPQTRLTAEILERMTSERTRLVAVSSVGFLDGYRHDLKALGAFCRERRILFAVDAMQAFGYLPLDVRACNIDFCYFGVAKWLLSPQGLSVLFVRADLIDALRPSHCSWRSVKQPMAFLDYSQELAAGARRFEGGTINYPALMGFSASLRLLTSAGLDAIAAHVLALNERLIERVQAAGVTVVSDRSPSARSGILLLRPPRASVQVLSERASRAKVGITVRDSGVRVSPHGYNDASDMDAVADVLTAQT
ncbi:MAG: hypothetical protein DLM53_12035 [Candidatus Eremiobacter antarcticus]|nr:aminotransferase class V-fold PLP-dependent enzyme [Candidatus Eremiobacteraeota bacterium]MBC5808933.1 aminotransferase class V-fold PLP-dependent enzyme [Candidatus Eremiobacteraeota bacterium]PZR60384.1 MAG: hypothetical protein DLM53_12035 [Candidatus Eremiobacter sp. RRmetagenome_bin22]